MTLVKRYIVNIVYKHKPLGLHKVYRSESKRGTSAPSHVSVTDVLCEEAQAYLIDIILYVAV